MAYDVQITNKAITISNEWAEKYRLLKKFGFVLYDQEADNMPVEMDMDFDDTDIVMVEGELLRNCICIILRAADEGDLYPDFDVYVQDDIACGFIEMPFRWSEIEEWWLRHLKIAFHGSDFTYHI